MKTGISTNRRCDPFADCLASAGIQFVIRYYSRTTQQPEKRISAEEAAELDRAGLEIATVYQDNGRLPEDFGRERGQLDGASAHDAAVQIGQPPHSAIYFAVDSDFSTSQIEDFVLPYFEGVKAGMDKAAGGTSMYEIGVYGSGLTCRLVKNDNALARFSWLGESTGWRESKTYADWDICQHVNKAALCGLGNAWEPCDARDEFGQFRPIGLDVEAVAGEMRQVSASQLNLRQVPTAQGNTPVARLPEGQVVQLLAFAADPWVRVRTTLGGSEVTGYVSSKYLVPLAAGQARAQAVASPVATAIPPAHYRRDDPQSRRGSTGKRAQPLGEPGRPARHADASPAERVRQVRAIVDWLDASHSARYQRDQATYCNVYAADFCYLAGAYLPRVWWTASALMRIAQGEMPPAIYDSTIREMRADDLHAWLIEFGASFGWQRVFDATALQAAANGGGIGVVCADRDAQGKPGHISIVVPEKDDLRARRDAGGQVVLPLQSQAGAVNFLYSTGDRPWWKDPIFRSYVFFIHA